MLKQKTLLTTCMVLFCLGSSLGQDEERIALLYQDAIKAMGGEVYLSVKDIVSEGNYFQFDIDGNSSGLIKYFDWTKLPDKSRNEIGNNKKERLVTVFNLEKNEGWILDGQKDTRNATKDEMTGFHNSAKHSLENILRFRYKNPAVKLFYLGVGEGEDLTREAVKLLDPENDEVTLYFDRVTKLPVKLEYRSTSNRGVRQRFVDEFSQWHVVQGVNTPLRVDTYLNGRKQSQMFVLKITYNNGTPDSFFSKPAPPK